MCSITWHHLPPHSWMTPDGSAYKRKILRAEKMTPALSEIKYRLGTPLSNIFLECIGDFEGAKDQIGLDYKLKGPVGDLWASPNDTVTGNLVHTVPSSPSCLQALTHQSILFRGKAVQRLVEEEHQRKLTAAIEGVVKQMNKEKKEAVEDAIAYTQAAEKKYYADMLEKLYGEIDYIIKKITEDLRCSLIIAGNEERDKALKNLRMCMEIQMKHSVNEREKYFERKFNFKLMLEANKYYEYYNNKIIAQQKKWSALFEEVKLKFHNDIKKMKVKLEAEHISDILRVYQEAFMEVLNIKEKVVKEVALYQSEKENLIMKHKEILKGNVDKILCRNNKIKELRQKLRSLAIDFQQFIQFTMNGELGQSEYLLSVEQIIKEDIECGIEEEILQEAADQEIAEIVLAIIFDTIMKIYCKKESISLLEAEENYEDGEELGQEFQEEGEEVCEEQEIANIKEIKQECTEEKREEYLELEEEEKEEPCSGMTHHQAKMSKQLEAQAEKERAANRAIDLIVNGISQTRKNKNDEIEDIRNIQERIKTVREVFSQHPSVTQLFRKTKAAVRVAQ